MVGMSLRVRLVVVTILLSLVPLSCQAENLSIPRDVAPALAEAKAHLVDQPLAALPLADQIEASARTVSDPSRRAILVGTAYWLRAEVALRTDAFDRAGVLLARGGRAIASISQPTKIRGDLLMSKGMFFLVRDRAADALSAFQSAYRTFEQVREPRSQAIALQNIGALYSSANDEARAEKYYKQASLVYSEDPLLLLALHNSRGNVLLVLERYHEANVEYSSALTIARRLDKPILVARVLDNLARSQVESGQLERASKTLAEAFRLIEGGETLGLRRLLNATAAKLSQNQGNLKRAATLIGETFEGLDLETTSRDFRTPHQIAYLIYRQLGDDHRALIHLEALKRLSDEASKVATTNSAALMAARFDYANQELTIQRLQTEQLRKAAEVQRTLFLLIGGATMVVIAMLTLGLVTIRRSRNEVQAANAVLANTNVALEKALRAKTEFLATTSHEIRTPLNGILGMTQVMLADAALDESVRDRVHVLQGAGLTMRALVDDILDVAKMETGNLTIDPVPMHFRALVTEVAQLWAEQAQAKGLAFDVEVEAAPEWIVSDPGRLRQVIFNLLSNAIKFTGSGCVGLRAVAVEPSGEAGVPGRLQISVHDTGIGIAPEKLDEIFESFRQADSTTTREYGGTGLGLTICRNLARALGGDIRVASVPGQGSTFTLDLPLLLADAPGTAPLESPGDVSILVVEQNPIVRAMLRRIFQARADVVHAVGTGEEALEIAAATPSLAAVVIDDAALGLSDNRLEILRKLKECLPVSAITVLSGGSDTSGKAQFLDAGVTQVIEKPIVADRLVTLAVPRHIRVPEGLAKDPLVSQAA